MLNICQRLNGAPLVLQNGKPTGLLKGVIVQFGGQTPLNLAQGLKDAGVPIVGTSPESIHLAEDREQFQKIIEELQLVQPPSGIAHTARQAREVATRIGYPLLVRPSYVLGGRAMEICDDQDALDRYFGQALAATDRTTHQTSQHPLLIDLFLSDAIEVDVDAVADGHRCVVAGVLEHIEQAGVHSGDSAMTFPPYSLSPAMIDQIKDNTARLAMRIGVRGLMNVQYAIKDGLICVLEVNPRASRTVPFVSKATGIPWAKLATKVMLGRRLDDLLGRYGLTDAPWPAHVSVKESVFPFAKFPGVDVILGPEMRSTGEVMGIDPSLGISFAKSQMAAGSPLPLSGTVFVSVNDNDKPAIVPIARQLAELGFNILASKGTHDVLSQAGIVCRLVPKISERKHPNMLDLIEAGTVQLLINTPTRKGRQTDEGQLRAAATIHNVPIMTTSTGARAAVNAIATLRDHGWQVRALQDYHQPN